MLQRRDGVIVNVSSISGKRAGPLGGAAYAAAKFGVGALATCLAAEEKDSGIRVSTICPGEVNTPILNERPVAVTDEQRRKMLQPDDIALAVLFVAALPPHVSVPEMIIKPTSAVYV
jgi:NADP-dependent 3-hydroxy acid dehydrogenase YdfG